MTAATIVQPSSVFIESSEIPEDFQRDPETGLWIPPRVGEFFQRNADTGALAISLLPWQTEVLTDPHQFRVSVNGRRTGKTTELAVELLTAAIANSGELILYLAPTRTMAKDLIWEPLKALIPREYMRGDPLEGALTIRLVNGAMIMLKSAENPDKLRGLGPKFVAMDEFAYINKAVWYKIMRPALTAKRGRAIFATTPRGFNYAYDLFQLGQGEHKLWKSWNVTTMEAGVVSQEEIEAAREEMDERSFAEEFMGAFEALGGRVYLQFRRDRNYLKRIPIPSKDDFASLYFGIDFNVNPMTAVVAGCEDFTNGRQVQCIASHEVRTSNTHELADYLLQEYGTYYNEWGQLTKRKMIACPDPSGKARKTSAGGKTDFSILREKGFIVRAPNAAPFVRDRVNNVNSNFRPVDGLLGCVVTSRCGALVRALEGLVYKPETSIVDKESGLDHITDGLGYLLWQENNKHRTRARHGRTGLN